MEKIMSLIKNGSINYSNVIGSSTLNINWDDDCRFGVIIPVRGRKEFLPLLLDSFMQTKYYSYSITVVEHSDNPIHQQTCAVPNVNYIHIPASGKPFNKCLAFNMGAMILRPVDYYIFHDLDCLVQKSFFNNIDNLIKDNNAEAFQPFKGRRILFCTKKLTEKLLRGEVDINDITIDTEGMMPSLKSHIGAPGGSMVVEKELFFKVGGYDPELFWSYAPEDIFFLHKLQLYTTVYSCDENEIFHLCHPLSTKSNPDLPKLIDTWEHFKNLSKEQKEEIIAYKRDLIKDYL